MRDKLPVVTISWGAEPVRIDSREVISLVDDIAKLEQAARDGEAGGPGTEYVGPGGLLTGPAAHLASVCLCIKSLRGWLARREIPLLIRNPFDE